MKENKRDYLRRILDIQRGDAGYNDMDTCMREYNKFRETLNYAGKPSSEEEKIFVYFYQNNLTVSNIVQKKKGSTQLKIELKAVQKKAADYYNSELYPHYREFAQTLSPKNSMIELDDKLRVNGIRPPLNDVDSFISSVDKQWKDFLCYLYRTINLVFSGDYTKQNDSMLRIHEFKNVVDEEIDFYHQRVKKYNNSNDDCASFYYVGQNENPYKNLYLYCLNSYIRNFYVEELPYIEPDHFYELQNIGCTIDRKERYSLKDIAQIYCQLSNCEYSKAYGKIKQHFRKSACMQFYKKNGQYEFDNIEIPLATYSYYSKKNHREPDLNNSFTWYDELIVYLYAPLLRELLSGKKERISAYINYCNFISSEFNEILKRVDDGYLNVFLEALLESSMRLLHRCSGLDLNSILG